jgi:hypothetical protein
MATYRIGSNDESPVLQAILEVVAGEVDTDDVAASWLEG